ncbi:MAG: hypothetical protein AABY22_00775, partial [Nanoarchaeota archaeon]
MRIHIDGAGFNGEDCAYCIKYSNKKPILKIIYENHNSIYMETLCLLKCLEDCPDKSKIYSDCQILVGYINYNWITHIEELKPMIEKIKGLLTEKKCKLNWLRREMNYAGLFL